MSFQIIIASRTKLMVSSKLKGMPGKPHTYPQPEGVLGEVMCKYGKDLSEETTYGNTFGKFSILNYFALNNTNFTSSSSSRDWRSVKRNGRGEVLT